MCQVPEMERDKGVLSQGSPRPSPPPLPPLQLLPPGLLRHPPNSDSDPEPGPKMTDQDAVDAFPVGKLTKLDELISNPRYVIFLSFVKFFMFFFLN